jgi:polyisoprenoid-binding protein YceI/DNA-binding MarR family transcriptional regulator
MILEEAIHQKKFNDTFQKLTVNILFTASRLQLMQQKMLRSFELTPAQFNILRILRGAYPNTYSVNELMERMIDPSSNTSRLVERLRLKKLISRKICPQDRRAVDVVISESGMQLLKRIDEVEESLFFGKGAINQSEAEALNELLDKGRNSILNTQTTKSTNMKKTINSVVVLAALFLASCGGSSSKVEEGQDAAEAGAGAKTFVIDAAASSLEWYASKVTGEHNGTVPIKGGELAVENNKLSAGKFTMDMTQIVVLDLTDAETNGKLTGHLKSEDFFSVEKSPESSFELVSAEAIEGAAAGAANYNVKGNLTIKGITKAISFPAIITMSESELTANAEVAIDRTEWDIKYGSGKFFEGLGDKMINDEFKIKFNIKGKV